VEELAELDELPRKILDYRSLASSRALTPTNCRS
jgi:hypothetical protein